MTNHAFLESFDETQQHNGEKSLDTAKWQETLRSEGFENGYASGWEDAIQSDKTSRLKLEAELERNVQNLVYTFGEAVTQVRSEVTQLLDALFDQLLPAITFHIVREHAKVYLLKMSDDLIDQKIEIATSSEYIKELTNILHPIFPTQISLIEDPTLSEAQVFMRLGHKETNIDLKPLVNSMIDQFNSLKEEEATWRELNDR